jgi:chemotaxis protein histidine kinase CheA
MAQHDHWLHQSILRHAQAETTIVLRFSEAWGVGFIGVLMSTSEGGGNIDPVMLELFGAEVDMHLPVLSEGLLAMEKGRSGKQEIESMMRAAHSIKGAARIVGNERAVRVAHVMEDCFTLAKEDRIMLRSDAVDVLLQGVDALQRICSSQPDPELGEDFIRSLLERIAAVRDGTTSSLPAAAAPAPARAADSPIVLPAQFDDSAAQSLRGQFCDILRAGVARVRIDFGQVEHLSVAAMSLLLSLAREAEGMQPPLAVEAYRVSPPVLTLFRVVGLKNKLVLSD